MQYRKLLADITVDDNNITIVATIGGNILSASVVRDGSEETNFKAAMWSFRQTLNETTPSATSLPCRVLTPGKWFKNISSGTITTPATVIDVPTGNSGGLILRRDSTSATVQYRINAGSWTTFADGDPITVADGNTLAFKATSVPETETVNGSVEDTDTSVTLDSISLYNTTPTP